MFGFFFPFFLPCAGLEPKKELGKEIENEYQCLWDTVTKLVVKYSFGDAFPIRKTSQLFLDQEQTLFRGTATPQIREFFTTVSKSSRSSDLILSCP